MVAKHLRSNAQRIDDIDFHFSQTDPPVVNLKPDDGYGVMVTNPDGHSHGTADHLREFQKQHKLM